MSYLTVQRIRLKIEGVCLIPLPKFDEFVNYPLLVFDLLQLLKFDRSGFKAKGPLELASEELIKMAAAGNFLGVEELLNAGTVHPDVADRNGHNALIGATVS
jgi:hypothetical protein